MTTKTKTSLTLIQSAFALVEGWQTRRVTRAKWHQADTLMMQAALIAPDTTMEAWERLATEYEAYLHSKTAQRQAA